MAKKAPNRGSFKPGDKRAGRPAGVPNKLTTAAKEAIEMAAEGLGGAARLQAWAQENEGNERAFWTVIYTKLLPLQVTGSQGKDLIPQSIAFVFQQQPESENRT